MLRFFSLSLVIFLLISSVGAGADADNSEAPLLESAKPFGPDELYEIALHQNPDHQKAVQNTQLSGSAQRAAGGTLLPTLNVGYQISQNNYYQPNYTNPDGSVSSYPYSQWIPLPVVLTDPTTGYQFYGWNPNDSMQVNYPIPEGKNRQSSGYVSLQETIRLGGQQLFGLQNSQITNQISLLQVVLSASELRFAVRQNYCNVLANKRLLELARQVLQQKQEFLRLAKARFEIGAVTELDVMQAEIDVGNQENAIITAQNNLKLAQEELNRSLGVRLDSQYELVDNYSIFQPQFALEDLIAKADVARPDYKITQQQIMLRENMVRIWRGEFFPNLTASLTHSRSQNSGSNVDFTLNPRNRNTSVSLSLSWNLFSGFSDEEQYQQSRVALRNAGFDAKKQQQMVEKEVRQAYYALIQTYEQSKITEKNRDLASRQLALEQERYRLGATSQLNLRVAQVTYEQAQADNIAKVFIFWSSLAALERAVGSKLQ